MSALGQVAKAKLKYLGGRGTVTDITATIFGCTGFIGRYVCAELGQLGCSLVIPYRGDDMEVRHIKVMADLGNVANIPFNVRDRESVREAVRGSDVVINLIGKHYQTKHLLPWWINYTYDDANVTSAKTIAEVCAEENVPRLIHHSSVMASPSSPSIWAGSKYRGEMAVRKAFPNVNIVRSSAVFGPEDRFLTWYGDRMSFGGIPLVDGGNARVQPVAVTDVAKAIKSIVLDEEMSGKTFELVGDDEYTHKEIAEYVFDVSKSEPKLHNIPLFLAKSLGRAAELFPDPVFTQDLAVRLAMDDVKTSDLPGLRELDIEPTNMEKEAYNFMIKYNRGGHFEEVEGYH